MAAVGGYELRQQVASSTVGGLWQGFDPALGRDVALKQVNADATDEVARLRAEAQLLAGLSHPNIVSVFDVVDADGSVWLVEEWVPGAALPAVLAQAGKLAPQQALGVIRGAVQGLAYAHRRAIVHGNISPASIRLDERGESKLVDFGPAAATATPGYLSPEAAAGQPITPRSDVYSAAAVLSALLSGRAGFTGPVPDLSGINDAVRTVLAKALSPNPADRYADADELLAALEEAAERGYGTGWLGAAGVAAIVAAVGSATVMSATGATTGAIAGPGAAATVPAPAVGAAQATEATQHAHLAAQGVAHAAPGRTQNVVNIAGRAVSRKAAAIGGAATAVVVAVVVIVVTTQHSSPARKPVAAASPATTPAVPVSTLPSASSSGHPDVLFTHVSGTATYRKVAEHCPPGGCLDQGVPPPPTSGAIPLVAEAQSSDNELFADNRLQLRLGTAVVGETHLDISGTIPTGPQHLQNGGAPLPGWNFDAVLHLGEGYDWVFNPGSTSSEPDSITGTCDLQFSKMDPTGVSGTATCDNVLGQSNGSPFDYSFDYAFTLTP